MQPPGAAVEVLAADVLTDVTGEVVGLTLAAMLVLVEDSLIGEGEVFEEVDAVGAVPWTHCQ